MGQLINVSGHGTWYDTTSTGGRFKRPVSTFRHWLTADGNPSPVGEGGFKAEENRYHLYVSLACPWAHRTLVLRKLKGLEAFLPVSVVHPLMRENGWTFSDDFSAATGDGLYQHDYLYQLYLQADPQYSGRLTVPVLWDKKQQTIVSNESADIIRMFNNAFDPWVPALETIIPKHCVSKLTSLMTGSITASTMGFIKPDSPPLRTRMTRR